MTNILSLNFDHSLKPVSDMGLRKSRIESVTDRISQVLYRAVFHGSFHPRLCSIYTITVRLDR